MRRGFTLIELLVVIAIIAILAAILFPVFARAREKARQASCQSNEKQIALAFAMYTQDYDGRFPAQWHAQGTLYHCWPELVVPYIKNDQVFICPSNSSQPRGPRAPQTTYGINSHVAAGGAWPPAVPTVISMDRFSSPATTILLSDSWNGSASCPSVFCPACFQTDWFPGGHWSVGSIHNEGTNLAYVDGHVKWLKQTTVIQIPVAGQDMWGHTG